MRNPDFGFLENPRDPELVAFEAAGWHAHHACPIVKKGDDGKPVDDVEPGYCKDGLVILVGSVGFADRYMLACGGTGQKIETLPTAESARALGDKVAGLADWGSLDKAGFGAAITALKHQILEATAEIYGEERYRAKVLLEHCERSLRDVARSGRVDYDPDCGEVGKRDLEFRAGHLAPATVWSCADMGLEEELRERGYREIACYWGPDLPHRVFQKGYKFVVELSLASDLYAAVKIRGMADYLEFVRLYMAPIMSMQAALAQREMAGQQAGND